MAPPVRLGLIGAGRWGRICLSTAATLKNGVAAGVASANPDTAALLPPGCRLFARWQDLLAWDGIDAVIVTTPTDTHVPIALAALDHGKAVFVEKPLCRDPDQGRILAQAAARRDLAVLVDHIHLFNAPFRRLLDLAADLGPVLSVAGECGKPAASRPDTPPLWDWGAHDVAMCLRLMGAEPDHVAAAIAERPVMPDGPGEIVDLTLRFGPVPARLRMGSLPHRRRWFRVECASGVLVYDDLAEQRLTLDGKPVDCAGPPPLTTALTEFCALVQDGRSDPAQLELAVAVIRVLTRAESGHG